MYKWMKMILFVIWLLPAPVWSIYLPNLSTHSLDSLVVENQQALEFGLDLRFQNGYKLNLAAPSEMSLILRDQQSGTVIFEIGGVQIQEISPSIIVPPLRDFEKVELRLEAVLYFCREDGKGACHIKSHRFIQTLLPITGGEAVRSKRYQVDLRAP